MKEKKQPINWTKLKDRIKYGEDKDLGITTLHWDLFTVFLPALVILVLIVIIGFGILIYIFPEKTPYETYLQAYEQCIADEVFDTERCHDIAESASK